MKHLSLLKKAISALIAAAMLLTATAVPAGAAKPIETAEEAVTAINAGWNLGNTLDSCGEWIGLYTDGKPSSYETAWGNPTASKKLIAAVKKAGFNAVRVPVTWAEHIDDSGNIDKEWFDRVQEVVDYVISQDMYCVLNVHHDAGADGWLEASAECYRKNSKKFAALWKNIALRFKDYGEKLIFEGFNEMLDSENSWTDARTKDAYKAVNDFNQLFVDTVRKTGGNNAERNLMVQVYSGSCSEKALAGFVLPDDTAKDHLIIHTHNYDPQGFTASDATWTTMTDKWGTDPEKAYFDKLFSRLDSFAKKQGAPLVIGEFGADFKDNNSSRKLYAEYFVSAAAKHGIKCFWWDTGNMALFDREKCTVTHPEIVKALTKYSVPEKSADKTEKLPRPKVTAKKSGSSITLKWNSIENAYCYRVYEYNSEKGKYVRIKTVKSTSCTIKLTKASSRRFVVCAVSKTDEGYKNGELSKAVKV
ncbi:MAG: cellulase family glycosylhydrolase [Huintestinicola sp.]|uniref:glycoside hydrolase family 5 protein n=1 Tax=Huintestinicola sp. TaxID=2981661 RepID=UPI003F043037